VLAWLRNEGVDVDAAVTTEYCGITDSRTHGDARRVVNGDAERKTVPFASLSSDAKLKTARGWASVPAERRAAFGSGVPPAALPALEERDKLVLETEKRDFLQKLIDDDEFQEDMRLASVRDAVDAVVRDFHAVVRFRGDERIMRVLEKFRVVQRFCKARGFKITYADVRVADAAEAEQRRKNVGELRERADAALAAACRAALAAERDQTRPNAPKTREEKKGVVSAYSASGRTTGRSPSTAVSEVSTKKRVFAVLGAVLRNQTVVVSLVAALCAFIAARVVERRERVSDGDGREFFASVFLFKPFVFVRLSPLLRRPHSPGTASSSKESTNARSTTGAFVDSFAGCSEAGSERGGRSFGFRRLIPRRLGPASPPTSPSARLTSSATRSVSASESPRLGKPLHSW
jgi:hypothetical protein